VILTFGDRITNPFSNSLIGILGFRVVCLCYENFHLQCVWVYVFWQWCENCFVSCHVSFLYVIRYLFEKKLGCNFWKKVDYGGIIMQNIGFMVIFQQKETKTY
jgi:hypothetical protein